MKKLLLAGPGTGKTTKVKKDFLGSVDDFGSVLVLSFTNATINDLLKSFAADGIPVNEKNCMTLHSYALRINHKIDMHVLNDSEEKVVFKYASLFSVSRELMCEMLNSITYDQMITGFIEFAKTNPAYLQEKIGRIKLLIVDEFQDFNEIEQSLVHLIAEYADETLILGDDDQCIYNFKDATSEGIVGLYKDATVENIVHENICYRCPDVVIEKSKNLLAYNKNRVPKDWHPSKIEGQIVFEQKLTTAETTDWIVQEILSARSVNVDASILVLAPVRFAIECLPEALDNAALPYVNFFANTFNLESYKKIWRLRLIYTRYKLLNLILIVDYSDLTVYKKRKFREMLKRHITSNFIFGNMQNEIAEFLDGETFTYLGNPPDFDELMKQEVWADISKILAKTDGDTPEQKLNKIDRYINPPTVFDPKVVNIMSIHKSKGLEATHVFIVGMVDGILPRKTDGIESMEMQRRLLFVGMTRTKKRLYLVSTVRWDGKHVHQLGREKFTPIYVGGRNFNGRTSPFINELGLE